VQRLIAGYSVVETAPLKIPRAPLRSFRLPCLVFDSVGDCTPSILSTLGVFASAAFEVDTARFSWEEVVISIHRVMKLPVGLEGSDSLLVRSKATGQSVVGEVGVVVVEGGEGERG